VIVRHVGVLLAAGSGSRFGGDKLLAALPKATHLAPAGTPIGAAACRHLCAATPATIAVVRPGDERVAAALAACGARVVECANADDGMGASLAFGVASTPDAAGWIVALADMPWIAPATIERVVAALVDGAEIAAPAYRGERGHPVGFSRRYFGALSELHSDEGARSVVAANIDRLTLIEVDDPGVVRDVDLTGDLLRDSAP
jgi:molybdenum cofactor cytidylyltransferase